MAQNPPPLVKTLFAVVLLLTTAVPTTQSLSYLEYQLLLSLSKLLIYRVANLRASRGDISGSNRAKVIADHLGSGLASELTRIVSDYMKNETLRDMAYMEMFGAISDLNELTGCLNELSRTTPDVTFAGHDDCNYEDVLKVSKSLFGRLIRILDESGSLRELVAAVEEEAVDGGLIKDSLELGTSDLKSLIKVVKELLILATKRKA